MSIKDLAEFYGVHPRTVHKWSAKKRQQKTTQALAGAEPEITKLIGEINQLAYIFDCQRLQGEVQVMWCSVTRITFELRLHIYKVSACVFTGIADLNAPDSVVRLLLLKNKLSEMVYGAQKIN